MGHEGYGGGITTYYTLTLKNATVSWNSLSAQGADTLAQGGGIYTGGPVRGTNSPSPATAWRGRRPAAPAVATPEGSQGSGIYSYNGAVVALRNTIVGSNSPADTNCAADSADRFQSAGYNLESGTSCAFTGTGDIQNQDPMLGALQDNGGSVLTQALTPNSPAIDTASNNGCPPKDARGQDRPVGPRCDIGAFEFKRPRLHPVRPRPRRGVRVRLPRGRSRRWHLHLRRPALPRLHRRHLNKPIVGGATDTSDYDGYWIVASDGGVFTFNARSTDPWPDRR